MTSWRRRSPIAAPGSVTETLSRVPERGRRKRARRRHRRRAACRDAGRQGRRRRDRPHQSRRHPHRHRSRRSDGAVTYADVFASQPFRNQLVTMTLTGAPAQGRAGAAMARSRSGRASCRSRTGSATAGTRQGRPASACRCGLDEAQRHADRAREAAIASQSTIISRSAATVLRRVKQGANAAIRRL